MSKLNESKIPGGSLSWIADPGCAAHMTFDESLFHTYETLSNGSVDMGTKDNERVVGRGTVILRLQCGSSFETRKLENVLHVPNFEYSLLSVSGMDQKGYNNHLLKGEVIIHKDEVIVATEKLKESFSMRSKRHP